MMGTLAGVLVKKHQIRTSEDRYRAEVEGDIEDVGGLMKITAIRVNYFLKTPPGKAEAAREALSHYIDGCPAAVSVRDCIKITHTLQVEEVAGLR